MSEKRFGAVACSAVALGLSLGLAACGDDGGGAGPPVTGTIRGTVTAEARGLEGVEVTLRGPVERSTSTAPDGAYAFAEVPGGAYTVELEPVAGAVFSTSARDVVVESAGQVVVASFQGSFTHDSRIEGVVRARGRPLAGVTVTLGGDGSDEATTGTDGGYAFGSLAFGEYTVSISGFGGEVSFAEMTKEVTLGAGASEVVTFSGDAPPTATVEIASITDADTGQPANPGSISGTIGVVVEVDPGEETITEVRLLLDGTVVEARSAGGGSSGTGVTAGGPAGSPAQDAFSFAVDTEVLPEGAAMDGSVVTPVYANGTHELGAEAVTAVGDAAAAGGEQLDFANDDRIAVTRLEGGQGIIGPGGFRYYGGEDVVLAATPVVYTGRTIGAVGLRGSGGTPTANATLAAPDLGAGPGNAALAEAPPFTFTLTPAENAGLENDDGSATAGFEFRVTTIRNDAGTDITGSFDRTDLDDLFLDFTGPDVNVGAPSEIAAGGVDIGGPSNYASGGAFGVTHTEDPGVGGAVATVDVDDVSSAADPDFPGITAVADLPERGAGSYEARIVALADALGNGVDLDATPVDRGDGADNVSEPFGVDRTPVALTNVLPADSGVFLNPVDVGPDGTPDGAADNDLSFTAADPALGDGSPGSGYGGATVTASDGSGVSFTPPLTPNASGTNAIDLGAPQFADGEWTVELAVDDGAGPPNEATHTWFVGVDTERPSLQVTDFPQGGTTSGSSGPLTIGGSISDLSGLSSVIVSVRADGDDAAGTNADGLCTTGDYELDPDAGEVDVQNVDVAGSASDFEQTFQVANAGGPVTYCIFIFAEDDARDNRGDPEPNRTTFFAKTLIQWL